MSCSKCKWERIHLFTTLHLGPSWKPLQKSATCHIDLGPFLRRCFHGKAITACDKSSHGAHWESALILCRELQDGPVNFPTWKRWRCGNHEDGYNFPHHILNLCQLIAGWVLKHTFLKIYCEANECSLIFLSSIGYGKCVKLSQLFDLDTPALEDMNMDDLFTYNASISACGNAKQWKCALSLIPVLRDQRLKPQLITYNTVISACENQWWIVKGILEEVDKLALERDATRYELKYSVYPALSLSLSPVSRMSERGSFFRTVMGNSSGVSHQISNGSDPKKGFTSSTSSKKRKPSKLSKLHSIFGSSQILLCSFAGDYLQRQHQSLWTVPWRTPKPWESAKLKQDGSTKGTYIVPNVSCAYNVTIEDQY